MATVQNTLEHDKDICVDGKVFKISKSSIVAGASEPGTGEVPDAVLERLLKGEKKGDKITLPDPVIRAWFAEGGGLSVVAKKAAPAEGAGK